MDDVRPTCCEKAGKCEELGWRKTWAWHYEEIGDPEWWGMVVAFEPGDPGAGLETGYGRVDFCPFCGTRLEAPSALEPTNG